MLKLTLIDDGSPIYIAAWHVVQVFEGEAGGTRIQCVGRIEARVREPVADVAGMVNLRGRR